MGEFPGGAWYITPWGDRGTMRLEPPFASRTSVRVADDRVYVALADAGDVRVYSNEGVLETLVRLPTTATAVRDPMVDCWWRGIEQMMAEESPSTRTTVLRNARAMQTPDVLPMHREILVDANLNLWVQSYEACEEPETDWWVFDPQGMWLGTVAVPTRLELFEIGEDYLLGRERDALDVEFVKVYALERPPD
jgi:hypothetical protein